MPEPEKRDAQRGQVRGGQELPPAEAQVQAFIKARGDIYASLQEIARSVQALHGRAAANDEASETSLAILKDRAERMETNLATLQQTADLVVNHVTDPRAREIEILASVVATMFDMGETLDTLKEALGGLTQQVRLDRETGGCAWRTYFDGQPDDFNPDGLFSNLARISRLAPKLETIIEDDLQQKGYDPKTGTKREWINIQIDKVREGIGASVVHLLGLGVLMGIIWLFQHLGAQQELPKIKMELHEKTAEQEALIQVTRGLVKRNEDLNSDNKGMKANGQPKPKKGAPAPAKPGDPIPPSVPAEKK